MKVIKWASGKSAARTNIPGDKIVLHKNSKGCVSCTPLLKEINNAFRESELYRHNKEYSMAVQLLKNAYRKTYELEEVVCQGCAAIFRNVIIDFFEAMENELLRTTKGIFRKKDYLGSLLLVRNTLWEFQKDVSRSEINTAMNSPLITKPGK